MSGTTGFLLGKSLPPHRGHQYPIEFARNYVDRLAVLVCSIEQKPIPGRLRYQWMCEAFPGVDLVQANRVLICTADAVTLAACAESSLSSCADEIAAADRRRFDLYLLAESADDLPDDGRTRRDRLAAMLATRELPLTRLRGPHEAQLRQACEAVDALLRARPG